MNFRIDAGRRTQHAIGFWSLSPSGSLPCPVVEPSGKIVPRGGTGWIGAQLSATGAGAVGGGGVAGAGGLARLRFQPRPSKTRE